MKKFLIALSLSLAAFASHADDLSDAKKLYNAKQFPQAAQTYKKLAEQGNVDAQVMLADMYWYGDTGSVDLAQAEHWFKQAAAKGNAQASASLNVIQQRRDRKSEIEFYTKSYEAAELDYAKFNCARPEFPAISRTKKQIREVNEAYKQWADCHERFSAQLSAALPAGKAIPKNLANIMSDEDIELARARMEKAYAMRGQQANAASAVVLADFDKWRKATTLAVTGSSEGTEVEIAMIQRERQMALERAREESAQTRTATFSIR